MLGQILRGISEAINGRISGEIPGRILELIFEGIPEKNLGRIYR